MSKYQTGQIFEADSKMYYHRRRRRFVQSSNV